MVGPCEDQSDLAEENSAGLCHICVTSVSHLPFERWATQPRTAALLLLACVCLSVCLSGQAPALVDGICTGTLLVCCVAGFGHFCCVLLCAEPHQLIEGQGGAPSIDCVCAKAVPEGGWQQVCCDKHRKSHTAFKNNSSCTIWCCAAGQLPPVISPLCCMVGQGVRCLCT